MKALAWFDRLPVSVQHALLLLAATLVLFGLDYVPLLDLPPVWAAVVAPLVTWVGAWATTVTRQYGTGSRAAVPDPAAEDKDH